MKIRADKKNYKNAYKKHIHTYRNWEKGSPVSRQLILCYCVECGLKCLIMQENRIERVSQAGEDLKKILGTHDFRDLLKAVKKSAVYSFPSFQTEYGETVTTDNFHQICRYCVKPEDRTKMEKFEVNLHDIAEWLSEVI